MARKRVRAKEADELNLIPIMNLVTILIPFLLMAASFISLAVIDTTLPAIGDPTPQEEPDEPPKEPQSKTACILAPRPRNAQVGEQRV